MKIAIAGVGGIGSNVAVNLVRSGISSLKLVDMDRVEKSNLNRQFYFADQIGAVKVAALATNLQRINPKIIIEQLHTTITPENCNSIFADCNFLVEGLDNEKSKKIILEELSAQKKLIVSASGIAGRSLKGIGCRHLGNCAIFGDFITDCRNERLYCHKLQAVAARMTERLLEEMP